MCQGGENTAERLIAQKYPCTLSSYVEKAAVIVLGCTIMTLCLSLSMCNCNGF